MSHKEIASAHAVATVLDLAYQQYSAHWQRIGNMQTSAGGVLTVIAIIASLLVAVTSQLTDVEEFLRQLGVFSYSFHLAFLFSFIYLVFASAYTYQVVKPKAASVLKDPVSVYENVDKEIAEQIEESMSVDCVSQIVGLNVLFKFNEEIISLDEILWKNQSYYRKCLLASFMSLGASFIALGHIVASSLLGSSFSVVIVGVLGYFCVLGLIPLIINIGGVHED